MFDRAFSRPKQELENTGPDGGPISYVVRAPLEITSRAESLALYAPPMIEGETE